MPKSKKSRQTSLFDIRIKSADHNVIVLKGPEHDASSALLSGVIVLSVIEPMPIKKLTLKLYATLRLNWVDHYQGVKGPISRPMRHEKKIYEYNWDPLNIDDYCKNLYQNQTSDLPGLNSGQVTLSRSNNSSNTSLKSLPRQSKSAINLSQSFGSFANLTHASQDKSEQHILGQGNYEFPFSTILPGSIPESIEGLPGCSMVYKLQSTIERGRFSQPLVTKKHIRVVRTLTSDAVELSETIAVDNTWPKKVDYSISTPTRAIAIGSSTRVDILLVPMLKGLRLGNIKVSMVEYYTYCGHVGGHTDERTILDKTIKKPKGEDGKDIWEELDVGLDGCFYNDGEISLSPDRWNITTYVQIPPSLNQCTQDCDVLSNVKVRHKLKFVIGLVNPDGHVSELRATLPIILFISPFVPLTARNVEKNLDEQPGSNVEDVTVENDENSEDVIFSCDPELSSPGPSAGALNRSGTATDTLDLMAPPNYENRVYDRLWSQVASPLDSPVTSGFNTPGLVMPLADIETDGFIPGFVPLRSPSQTSTPQNFSLNNAQLVENLRLLHLQREGPNQLSMDDLTLGATPASATRHKPNFTISSEDLEEPDYFSFKAGNDQNKTIGPSMTTGTLLAQTPGVDLGGLLSPGMQTPLHQHLSRSNSQADLLLGTPLIETSAPLSNNNWDENLLSRVPSYSTAMKSDPVDDFTPLYEPPLPGSSIDLLLLNKRLLAEKERSQLSASTTPTTIRPNKSYLRRSNYNEPNPITFDLAKSRGSSLNSSPAVSRNQSSSNLFGFNSSNSNSGTKLTKQLTSNSTSHQATSVTPQSKSPSSHSHPHPHAHSASTSNFNLSSMTPLTQKSPPPQAHVHNLPPQRPEISSSKSTLNMAQLVGNHDIKPTHSPSFLGLSKRSHSAVNLGFLHKKR